MVKNNEDLHLALFLVWAIFKVFGWKLGVLATIGILQSVQAGRGLR